MTSLHLVWFKRDLRLRDHRPLWEARRRGKVVPIFVFEPSLWASPEYDPTHFEFVRQSLTVLDENLRRIGGRLAIRVGELPDVFAAPVGNHVIHSISSHEETGTQPTYERDKRVARWCRENRIDWFEYPRDGVVRRLKSRDGWAAAWAGRMAEQALDEPKYLDVPTDFDWGVIPTLGDVVSKTPPQDVSLQQGGENIAMATLDSFLSARGRDYRRAMSSPITAESSCSRLSPYLAWGNLSIKQVKQAVDRRLFSIEPVATADPTRNLPARAEQNISSNPDAAFRRQTGGVTSSRNGVGIEDAFVGSLRSFSSRLSWHCHFIQKLEAEPEIEFQNVCRLYDGLRENEFDDAKFEAWKAGRTGFPMIDACMRYLHYHRWLNFRMRAMVMSFAAYHLWLHWRQPASYLAGQFLDFEPGIHFPQCQMQSGVTGINTIRIYSPSKQLIDQDPTGEFVRRWIPELEHVPTSFLAEPHRMSRDDQLRFHCRIGIDYPLPVVDAQAAVRYAKDRIYAIRQTSEAQQAARQVYLKHGSRKPRFRDPLPGTRPTPEKQPIKRRSKISFSDRQPRLPGMEDS